jgi:GT2 family glycosyltransferase
MVDALLSQTRPVQRVVAVDTGSRDRSGSVLAGLLGRAVVFGMDRDTGFGDAVARALRHRAANVGVPAAAGLARDDRFEWVWLLHDDCEPAPDALEQLLRGAAGTRSVAVLGPKVKDWADRRVILEAGLSIDSAGRRITGVEPREVDQGQHDGDRDTLAVGSAGMLVRRDVWEDVGGFAAEMPLFRDDVDFCWRAHAAGYRVRVITDAVVYHVEAAARRRRPISVSRHPHRLDRRNALLTLFGNLPAGPMLASAAANLAVSLLRVVFFLLAKRIAAALDEFGAVGSVLMHPLRLASVRRERSRGRRAAYARLRGQLPRGQSARRIAEFAAAAMSGSAQLDTAGSHHATDDLSGDDFLLTDTGFAQRVLTSPGVLLFIGLTVLALVAERSLLGAGPLGGGALVPAWGGATGLWHEYLQGFHPTGVGSGSAAPPWLAVVAALATVLGGKPWLAVDVILLGCVPLAGVTAFLAVRRVTKSVAVRVWAAASYALLPVAVGTVAAGRFGSAAVFVLIPVIALLTGRMFTQPQRRARRAAWATGLTVAVAAAFVPLVWVAVVIAAIALAAARPAMWRNLAIVAAVPPVLLVPWTFQVIADPSALLLQAGLQQPAMASRDLPARALLLLSPGGPGLPPVWVTAGLALAALAALLLARRRSLVLAGWGVALFGIAVAVAVSRMIVTPATGGPAVPGWPGVPLLIAAAGLLLAAAAAGDGLPGYLTGGGRGQRGSLGGRALAVVVLSAACSAPVLVAVSWVTAGVQGPVAPAAAQVVPPVVAATANSDLQDRTLVLRSVNGRVSYTLLRGSSPALGDSDLTPAAGAQRALGTAVAALVSPNGGEAVPQSRALSHLDVGFVLMPAPVDPGLAQILDGVAGLRPVSSTPTFALWRLVDLPARVRVVEPDGTVVPVPSGQVGVSGAAMPAAGGTLELAEPVGGWNASVNGRPLVATASAAGAWAQAFRLPPGGGRLDISPDQTPHDLALLAEALALLAVAALALPGMRTAAEAEAVRSDAAAADDLSEAASADASADAADDAAADDAFGDGAADSEDAAILAAMGEAPTGGADRGRADRGRVGTGGRRRLRSPRRPEPEVAADPARAAAREQTRGLPGRAAAAGPPGRRRFARPGATPAGSEPVSDAGPPAPRPYLRHARPGAGSGPLPPPGRRSGRHGGTGRGSGRGSGRAPSVWPSGTPADAGAEPAQGPWPPAEPAGWDSGVETSAAEGAGWESGAYADAGEPAGWDTGAYPDAAEPAGWESGGYADAGEPAGWDTGADPDAAEPAGWDTGAYPDPAEQAGWESGGYTDPGEPAGWDTGADPDAAEPAGWDSRAYPAGTPAGWDGDEGMLDPLPQTERRSWPDPADEDSRALQWPVPESDGRRDGW